MAKANRPRTTAQLLEASPLAAAAQQARPAIADSTGAPQGPAPAELLPEAVREHVDAVMEDSTLVLLARNNAVAQLLRFHGPRMARQLGARNWVVRVSVRTAGETAAPVRRAAPRLPEAAARCLRDTAATIDDPALREALERLARNGDTG